MTHPEIPTPPENDPKSQKERDAKLIADIEQKMDLLAGELRQIAEQTKEQLNSGNMPQEGMDPEAVDELRKTNWVATMLLKVYDYNQLELAGLIVDLKHALTEEKQPKLSPQVLRILIPEYADMADIADSVMGQAQEHVNTRKSEGWRNLVTGGVMMAVGMGQTYANIQDKKANINELSAARQTVVDIKTEAQDLLSPEQRKKLLELETIKIPALKERRGDINSEPQWPMLLLSLGGAYMIVKGRKQRDEASQTTSTDLGMEMHVPQPKLATDMLQHIDKVLSEACESANITNIPRPPVQNRG